MTSPKLDKRLNAFRPDLADKRLEGQAEAQRFVEGAPMRVIDPFADLLEHPEGNAGLQTQILHGHSVNVFDTENGWCWVQRAEDGYVGYVRENTLAAADGEPTHMVSATRTFLYPGPDLTLPRVGCRSIGSKLEVVDSVTTRGTGYLVLADGTAVIARHLIALGDWSTDYVGVAETLMHTPYLWGGDTGFGIDCSGLVCLSNMLCGKTMLRDSDMQADSVGEALELNSDNLRRGDLVFWKGHVGIMSDELTLLHANGNTMNVALEPLHEAIARIGYLYGQPTSMRRP